ncbi:MAG: 4'-phosphopantetheinyl transferase superfamily protein [Oscillospiraceae bacterium]|nr:4'-phosphopantetheinyl transferase superfamily protein [Oscillospiraceae bacterium]
MVKLICTTHAEKNGSATAYSLLAKTYGSLYGSPMPEISKTPNGKPFFPDRPDIHFSLSHSATHVLCAVSSSPVGADIETPRHISERTLRYFYSPEEAELFAPLDLWVLKESYIKLIGGTLAMVKTLRFSRCNDIIITPDRFSVSMLYNIDGCHAAVSSSGDSLPTSIELLSPLS